MGIFETDIVQGNSSSALNILVHPLVLINISDSYTRTQIQEQKVEPVVYGALLGTQEGRNIEIQSTVEIAWSSSDAGEVIFDFKSLKQKHEQFLSVFPEYELLGWYSTGGVVADHLMDLHEQVIDSGMNENPLFLLVDPSARGGESLPLGVYESELRIIDQVPKSIFVRNVVKIESAEVERVAVDHVAHVSASNEPTGSALINHLDGLQSAIKILSQRLKTLVAFLVAMQESKIPVDHCLLRHINAMCNRLPVVDSPEFRAEFLGEYNDSLLIAYLATVTKGANTINDMVEKFSSVNERRGRGRMYG